MIKNMSFLIFILELILMHFSNLLRDNRMSYYIRILIYAMIYCTASFYSNHQYIVLVTTLTRIKMAKNR